VGDPAAALHAQVFPEGVSQEVVWSMPASTAARLEGRTILGLEPGVVTLTVASKSKPEVLTLLEVHIHAAPTIQPTAVRIANLAPVKLVVGGAPTSLQALVEPAEANQGVQWAMDSAGVAEIVNGNQIRGLMAGKAKVIARSTVVPTIAASLEIVVDPAPVATPTAVIPSPPALLALKVTDPLLTLRASVEPAEASQAVVWTLDGTAGVVEIVNGTQLRILKAGTTRLKVASVAKPSISATVDVKVEEKVVNPASISMLVPNPMSLAAGGADGELSVRVLPTGASQAVAWTSSDTMVARITPEGKVKPLKAGKSTLTVRSVADPAVTATLSVEVITPVKVDGITLSPKTLNLYAGGATEKITAAMTGNDSGARYILSSSLPGIASVAVDGTVKGWAAGKAVITASVVGYPAILATCTVTVVVDPPVASVTADQNVAYGAEAVFEVSVTQAHGSVVSIQADMDGDGVLEEMITGKATAQFKRRYTEIKVFNLKFQVKDSEGNVVEVGRKVTVSPPPVPVVDIIDPAAAITINQTSYTIRYTMKDPSQNLDISKDSVVALVDGANTIRVVRSNAGGTGSDQVVITVNRQAPGVPVFTTQAQYQNDNTPAWSWGAVVGAAKYQIRLGNPNFDQPGTTETTTTAHASAAVADGDYTLFVRSVDGLGNASSPASQTVTVDTRAPDAVAFSGVDNGFTDDATPTWSWSPSITNGGIGTYVLSLDGGAVFEVTGTSYTPTSVLSDNASHTLSVRQKDRVEGVLGAAKTFTYQVVTEAPAAPTVSNGGPMTGNRTRNLAFTWTDGARGQGVFRVKVNDEPTYREVNNSTRSFSLPNDAADGVYTLTVQERDALNRWGAEGKVTVTLDRTGPAINITEPRANYITNKDSVIMTYLVDGEARTSTCKLTLDGRDNLCAVQASDDLGNSTSRSVTVYRRSKVIFVTEKGSGDGSSWETATSNLGGVVSNRANAGKEVWVASGTYGNLKPDMGITLLGGFNATQFPTNANGRTKNSTYINSSFSSQTTGQIVMDGFVVTKSISVLFGTLTLTDVSFVPSGDVENALLVRMQSRVTANNIQIVGRTFKYETIEVSTGAKVTFNGGSIVNNTSTEGRVGIKFSGGGGFVGVEGVFDQGVNVYGNSNGQISVQTGATINITSSANIDCRDIVKLTGGTGTCKGRDI
ncbi:MAG TPA: Ig-like domain-containing protein, partial [Fibrobacteria bacterium]|nr:Ig-like domain-containing protein [Fibrobacteria bacterium]